MIELVVALASEAQPIIEAFDLQRSEEIGGLRIHRGGEIRLTICGMGRRSATVAVERLRTADVAAVDGGRRADAVRQGETWINFGIGGHSTFELGTPVLAQEVLEQSSGRRWKMAPPELERCCRAAICTVDRVERKYEQASVYEMEASGFVSALKDAASPADASIQVLKVVSDNLRSPVERLDKARVREFCRAGITTLAALIDQVAGASSGP